MINVMRIPNATYRLQFHAGFGFAAALEVADYLADLGGAWIYASPLLAARPGSVHGYDGIDPNRLNPELGTEAAFTDMTRRLAERGTGLLLDLVPNHMAFCGEAPLLADLFENGAHSAHRRFFDIDWDHPAPALNGRLAAPLLGDALSACLARGEIRLVLRGGTLGAAYYEHFFPLRRNAYAILDPDGDDAPGDLPLESRFAWTDAIRTLAAGAGEPPSVRRDDRVRRAKATLRRLHEGDPAVRDFVEVRLASFDPGRGGQKAVEALERLLDAQVYRLRHWCSAGREINYRRFFDINELICLRQESAAVFDHTHRLVRRLVKEGRIQGLRIDHVDGLRHPGAYLRRLRDACGDIYIAAEKILAPEEDLPLDWPVQGTTGYEFADRTTRLACRPDPRDRLSAIYRSFSGRSLGWADVCRSARRQVLEDSFGGDLDNLVRALRTAIAPAAPAPAALTAAATELLIRLPVYRTYGGDGGAQGPAARRLRPAAAVAAARRPSLKPVLDRVVDCLLAGEPHGGARMEAWARFQQLSAPLAAKGIEDTALYRFVRLVSLNEVGGVPSGRPEMSMAAFHAFLESRSRRWPHGLNTLSTHDTKRSEDVRARINVLSEMPARWAARCRDWRRWNEKKKEHHHGAAVPAANLEYLLYQTLVGAFPWSADDMEAFAGRIRDYMVKAARETKEQTGWLAPDTAYEAAQGRFVDRLLLPAAADPFLADLTEFARHVARFGVYASLTQTLLKIAAPGVPDFYQGTELFDFSLVDPDNRRPVDFARRREMLAALRARRVPDPPAPRLGEPPGEHDDRMKLFLVHTALRTRLRHASLFRSGGYRPLETGGRFAAHVVAFARIHQGRCALAVAPRWLVEVVPDGRPPLGEVWRDTVVKLPDDFPAAWSDALSGQAPIRGRILPLARLLERFPAALLLGGES
jgi:(1->4)-alpha-D-glucan 1-alpha-D-glucosylmutase